ncbi:hypothetical protein H6F75_07535 [Nodosilinea sp. FACHB-131]|uniref:hypothetical protein n=1 Tax=Cyanophyceae TaxID=3028117 RepID=UPI0016897A5C|nr:hypothetical protein [Nodosilinea sp. FACHB-131]MBD1873329.1 hypothetical protein [Nodosilinea sp. FACHB-131]
MTLPKLLPLQKLQERLLSIFTDTNANRHLVSQERAGRFIFVMLYVGAVEGENVWASIQHVTAMSDSQASLQTPLQRRSYHDSPYQSCNLGEQAWYSPNARETIRRLLLPELIRINAVVVRSDLPLNSPQPRYALKREFAALFNAEATESEFVLLKDEWIKVNKPYLSNQNTLSSIPPGNDNAGRFHDFIFHALQKIFHPTLHHAKKEQPINDGRKKIDITFTNEADRGFFRRLVFIHSIKSPYVFFECKNYSNDPKNPEIDQLVGRLNDRRGRFGVLVCRTVDDPINILARCRDVVHSNNGYIVVLTDDDIIALLDMKGKNNLEGIDNYMEERLRSLIL